MLAFDFHLPFLAACAFVYFGLNVLSVCCCLAAKDKGEKKLFGYSFVPLMQEDGRTLPDGTHELIIHKVRPKCSHEPRRGPSQGGTQHDAFDGAETFIQICKSIQD